ncbi:MAG: Kelch repeat-containing protein, partial [Blastocatellia bacterium]
MLSFDSFRKSQPARIGVMIGFALLLMVAAVIKEPRRSQAASRLRQSLTVEDRVAAQRAIEEVYQRHRIWPKDNPQPKPALAALMPESALRAKVDDYLRLSNALEHYWRRPISGEQLQAEIERMQSRTKRPEALRELWAALGDDPLVIAECLARPALAERLSREWYASDERFHGALKQQAGLVLGQLRTGGQPRHTSGEYREVEWRADESELARLGHGLEINGVLRLDAAHWQEQVHRLSETFGSAGTTMDLPVGRWSGLQEDDEKFYAAAVLEKSARRLKVAEVVWQKTPFDQWWNEAQHELSLDVQPTAFVFRLPQSAAVPGQCAGEAWTATSTSGAPATRNGHAAVWTGSEMIVWGGLDGVSAFNTGGKYNPATETWTAMSTSGAPSPRSPATGVWTGTEMVIWGGSSGGFVSTGGRYNPSTNSWTPITNSNPPEARGFHTALWSGTEMIIWGGSSGTGANVLFGLNTGGRYNPASDTWMPVSTLSAPGTRLFHTAVWSGSEMLVWGGFSLNAPSPLTWDTGGRYNPSTNTWSATTTSGAPSARASHSAIWTGSEMIIWGGGGPDLDSGGKYNPVNNSWTATSTTNAPAPRRSHTAVWTGSEMIVWGGLTDSSSTSTEFNSGGRYNPITNTWTATSTANAPGARYSQTAVWAGNQMIVWGGLVGSGAYLTRLNT